MRRALVWLVNYHSQIRTGPGELVLAIGMTLWAALLWLPRDSFLPGSVFFRLEQIAQGESTIAAFCTVLAFLQWCGLIVDGWSPKFRAWVIFTQIAWWLFVTIEAAVSRWWSPVWATTLIVALMSVLVWLRLQAEITRAEDSLRVGRAPGDADGVL